MASPSGGFGQRGSGGNMPSLHKPWIIIQAGALMNIAAIAHVEKSGTVTDLIFHSSMGDTGVTVTFANETARNAAYDKIITHLEGMAVFTDLS